MSTVKELVTRFGFEIDDKGLKQLEGGISAIKDGLLGLGVVAGSAAFSLYEVVKHAAEEGNQLSKMSQKLGIGTEQLQELTFAAGIADVGMEDFGQTMTFLNRNLDQARQGSPEVTKAFRQLGFTGEQLRSGVLNAGNALDLIGRRFAQLPDGPRKVALAMDIFGRAGARMIPFLNTLTQGLSPLQRQILEMNRVTEQQAEAGVEFNDSLRLMGLSVDGIAKQVGYGLLPVAKDVLDQITRWIVENKQLVKTNVEGFVRGLTASLKVSIRFADIFVKSISAVANALGGVEFATKALLVLLSVLAGASTLIGIGKLMQAVVALGNSFAVANIKAAAIPLAIGAAMVGLLLIMEDIFSFFSGKDSFFGDFLSFIPEIGKMFEGLVGPIFEPFVNIMTMLTDGFKSWKDIFKELGVLIVNLLLTPLRGFFGLLGGVTGAVARLFGGTGETGATIQDFAKGIKMDSRMPGASVMGVTPQDAIASVDSGKQISNTMDVKQEFNFPPGTDPIAVVDKISTNASDGLGDVLRSTQLASGYGGAY